jgi:hypothetical protein
MTAASRTSEVADTSTDGETGRQRHSVPKELPRLLKERNETLRAFVRSIGGADHSYLSRMVSGKAAVNAQHAKRIAIHFGLPADYFPELNADEHLRNSLGADAVIRSIV